jgi:hypothetical protein
MDTVNIRYGEYYPLPIDAMDVTAVSADIYIGRPGQPYVLTKHADLVDGVGTFEFEETETTIPLGKYNYQINLINEFGKVRKFPSPEGDCDGCDNSFPEFIVWEALDSIEVS